MLRNPYSSFSVFSHKVLLTCVFFADNAFASHVLTLLEGEEPLGSRVLLYQFRLVVAVLGHELATEVLYLIRELFLHCFDLFAHNRAPNGVELVQDLGDGHFTQLALELVTNFEQSLDGFGRNPI